MPKVSFVESDGRVWEAEAEVGRSVMEAARLANVPGIPADCGGACSCATCHVYISPEWQERVGTPNVLEADMLEAVDHPTDRSRLSCQITLTADLDGLVCEVPAA